MIKFFADHLLISFGYSGADDHDTCTQDNGTNSNFYNKGGERFFFRKGDFICYEK